MLVLELGRSSQLIFALRNRVCSEAAHRCCTSSESTRASRSINEGEGRFGKPVSCMTATSAVLVLP